MQSNERHHHYHRLATAATEYLAIAIHLVPIFHMVNTAAVGTILFSGYTLATAVYLKYNLALLRSGSD